MRKPVPRPTAETAAFWQAAEEGRLLFQRCGDCGRPQFYPRRLCAACGSSTLGWEESGGRGRIAAVTEVHRGPTAAFAAEVPYLLALVDLDEGFRMMMNLRGCSLGEAALGARVRVFFEEIAESPMRLPQARLEAAAC